MTRSSPCTPAEEAVLAIWQDVLGRSDVGVHDDLAALAGSSLLALQAVARVRKELGVDVPVQVFFESPTVAALAASFATDRAVVTRRPRDAEAVLSFDQERLWLENQLVSAAVYNVHGRERLVGPLDVAALEASIRTILVRHETLRTRYPTVDGRPVPVVEDAEDWRLEVVDVTDAAEAARLADEQAAAPFDLAQGPLFRCLLARLGSTEHLLGITAHHIVCDVWSVGLFVRELAALYPAGGDPSAADLPDLPVQFRDYAACQRRQLTGDVLDREVGYWRAHLTGAPPSLALPNARRLTPSRGDAGRAEYVLSREDRVAMHELCRRRDVTTFMVLLACLATVLARWSGQRDLVIGVPIAHRSAAGTEKLIGFFVNTLPFRIDLSDEPRFAELLARVRRLVYDGHAHAEAPLDMLVKELQAARDPVRTPLFQVILSMLDDTGSEHLGDLVTEPVDQPVLPRPFDLNVTAEETRDGALAVHVDFDACRYAHATMTALAEQLGTLLHAVTADPTGRVLDYPLALDERRADDTPAPGHWTTGRFALGDTDRFAVLSDSPYHLTSAQSAARHAGGTLVLPDYPPGEDVDVLTAWLRDNGVTVLFTTPSLLRAVSQRPLAALRYVFVDNPGDLLAHDIGALRRAAPSCRCVGTYRTREDGTPLTAYRLPDDYDVETAPVRVPLGAEVDMPARLVHPSGTPAAVGEIAEICFGTLHTGDHGRRLPDGTLELAGVPGDDVEVMAALRDVPGVHDALVATDGTGYVASSDPWLDATALRQHLATLLPDDLIPSRLAVLERLPLTVDGGYDESALPHVTEEAAREGYVAPRTPMEQQLTEILQELLGIKRVGVHDGFFDMGGFSLLATQLTSRIREQFGVELSLRDVFEFPTVSGLAQRLVLMQGDLPATELEALLDEISAAGDP